MEPLTSLEATRRLLQSVTTLTIGRGLRNTTRYRLIVIDLHSDRVSQFSPFHILPLLYGNETARDTSHKREEFSVVDAYKIGY